MKAQVDLIPSRLNSGDVPSRFMTVLRIKGQKGVANSGTHCWNIFHFLPKYEFMYVIVLQSCKSLSAIYNRLDSLILLEYCAICNGTVLRSLDM